MCLYVVIEHYEGKNLIEVVSGKFWHDSYVKFTKLFLFMLVCLDRMWKLQFIVLNG